MIDKKLFSLLGREKILIFLITAINLLGMFANLGITAILCYSLYLKTLTGKLMFFLFFLLLIKFFSFFLVGRLKTTLAWRVKYTLRQRCFSKLLKLGINGSKESLSGLTQTSIEGIEQLDLYYSQYLPQFFFALISPIILFTICVTIEYKTALVLLASVPIIPLSIIFVSKYASKVFKKYWGKYTSMGDSFLDSIQGMKELKIFNADAQKQVETAVKSEEFRKITMKVLIMQLTSITIMDLVAFGGAGIAIVMTLLSATSETATPLSPFLALFLVLISAEFFLPMRALGAAFHVAMNGATAGKKILAFLALPDPEWGTKEATSISKLVFKEVDFSYNHQSDDESTNNAIFSLSNINMELKKGFNAVVGESGSGKSTLVSLLLGSYPLQKGEILIGDENIRDFTRNSFYHRLALVSYNTFIFNTSIRENFQMADPTVSDETIFTALEKVNLKEFVLDVGGLDTIIIEDSENISGGQRQRLALAINLTTDKELYIFDEATSNVDVDSEAIIVKNIKELSLTKIVILISHRSHNITNSDAIFVIEDGKITREDQNEAKSL